LLPALAATGATLFGIGAARAQPAATSTWDQIMQTRRLRVGAALSEPWYFRDTSSSTAAGAVRSGDAVWRGIGPRLGEAIARAMNVQLELVELTWGNAVAALQSNQIDTMFILDPTPERALAIDFVASPVLWYPIAALAKNDFAPTTWAQLNEPAIRCGVALGTSTDQTLTRLSPRANIQRYQTTGELLAAWQSNRIDAAFTTGPTVDLAIARLRSGKNLIPRPIVAVPAGAGVRKEQDNRWANYLATVVAYYYNSGITQGIYDEFMAFRGLEAGRATAIQREAW
ncbi:MAG: amino acid ABC transporter, partial [Rhodospirillales bacterium]|nr:amino acid ABC transporter [Rhodospirillales bacterium]